MSRLGNSEQVSFESKLKDLKQLFIESRSFYKATACINTSMLKFSFESGGVKDKAEAWQLFYKDNLLTRLFKDIKSRELFLQTIRGGLKSIYLIEGLINYDELFSDLLDLLTPKKFNEEEFKRVTVSYFQLPFDESVFSSMTDFSHGAQDSDTGYSSEGELSSDNTSTNSLERSPSHFYRPDIQAEMAAKNDMQFLDNINMFQDFFKTLKHENKVTDELRKHAVLDEIFKSELSSEGERLKKALLDYVGQLLKIGGQEKNIIAEIIEKLGDLDIDGEGFVQFFQGCAGKQASLDYEVAGSLELFLASPPALGEELDTYTELLPADEMMECSSQESVKFNLNFDSNSQRSSVSDLGASSSSFDDESELDADTKSLQEKDGSSVQDEEKSKKRHVTFAEHLTREYPLAGASKDYENEEKTLNVLSQECQEERENQRQEKQPSIKEIGSQLREEWQDRYTKRANELNTGARKTYKETMQKLKEAKQRMKEDVQRLLEEERLRQEEQERQLEAERQLRQQNEQLYVACEFVANKGKESLGDLTECVKFYKERVEKRKWLRGFYNIFRKKGNKLISQECYEKITDFKKLCESYEPGSDESLGKYRDILGKKKELQDIMGPEWDGSQLAKSLEVVECYPLPSTLEDVKTPVAVIEAKLTDLKKTVKAKTAEEEGVADILDALLTAYEHKGLKKEDKFIILRIISELSSEYEYRHGFNPLSTELDALVKVELGADKLSDACLSVCASVELVKSLPEECRNRISEGASSVYDNIVMSSILTGNKLYRAMGKEFTAMLPNKEQIEAEREAENARVKAGARCDAARFGHMMEEAQDKKSLQREYKEAEAAYKMAIQGRAAVGECILYLDDNDSIFGLSRVRRKDKTLLIDDDRRLELIKYAAALEYGGALECDYMRYSFDCSALGDFEFLRPAYQKASDTKMDSSVKLHKHLYRKVESAISAEDESSKVIVLSYQEMELVKKLYAQHSIGHRRELEFNCRFEVPNKKGHANRSGLFGSSERERQGAAKKANQNPSVSQVCR